MDKIGNTNLIQLDSKLCKVNNHLSPAGRNAWSG